MSAIEIGWWRQAWPRISTALRACCQVPLHAFPADPVRGRCVGAVDCAGSIPSDWPCSPNASCGYPGPVFAWFCVFQPWAAAAMKAADAVLFLHVRVRPGSLNACQARRILREPACRAVETPWSRGGRLRPAEPARRQALPHTSNACMSAVGGSFAALCRAPPMELRAGICGFRHRPIPEKGPDGSGICPGWVLQDPGDGQRSIRGCAGRRAHILRFGRSRHLQFARTIGNVP